MGAKIESKYDMGQEVYFLINTKLQKGKIVSIKGMNYRGHQQDLELEVYVTAGKFGAFFWKFENELYPTKEMLLEEIQKSI